MPSFSVYFEFSAGDEVFYVKDYVIRVGTVVSCMYSDTSDEPIYDIQFKNSNDKAYRVTEDLMYRTFADVCCNSAVWNKRLKGKAE